MIGKEDISILINKGNWKKILQHLKNGNIKPNTKLIGDNLISHLAAAGNQKSMIEYYYNNHKNLLGKNNSDGENAYHIMAKFGYFDLLKLVVPNNADSTNLIDKNGNTILHYLSENPNKYFEWILDNGKNIDLNIINNGEETVLTKLIQNTKVDSDIFFDRIFMLKEHGADFNIPKSETALIKAINQKKSYVANYLIDNGANIDIKDRRYLTPFLLSVLNELDSTTKKLINKGIDINYLGAEGDNNPLTLVLSRGNETTMETLLENGFDITKYDRDLNTPLHLAFSADVNLRPSIISKLIYYGDLNQQNINGDTPLHLFLRKYNWSNYNKILENKKLDIFVKNHKGYTPLDYVNNRELVEFLDVVTTSFISNYGSLDKCSETKKLECHNRIKEYIMENKRSIFDRRNKDSEDIELIIGKDTNYGRFNSDILHNVIYTLIMLKKNKELSIPFQYYNKSKAATKQMLLDVMDFSNNKSSNVLSELVKIYYEYFFEIAPYLLVWRSKTLHYVDKDLEFYVKKSLDSENVRYIFFKLTLISSGSGTHANIIIFDKHTGILERFEPYGIIPYLDNDEIDIMIKDKLGSFLTDYLEKNNKQLKYFGPRELFDGISFQIISNDTNSKVKKLGDPTGFCLAWTFWYLEMRMKHPDTSPKDLVKNSLEKIKNMEAKEYREHIFIDFIRKYAADLDDEKNKFLIKVGIDKKHVYNMQFNDKDNKKIFNKVLDEITKIIDERTNKN